MRFTFVLSSLLAVAASAPIAAPGNTDNTPDTAADPSLEGLSPAELFEIDRARRQELGLEPDDREPYLRYFGKLPKQFRTFSERIANSSSLVDVWKTSMHAISITTMQMGAPLVDGPLVKAHEEEIMSSLRTTEPYVKAIFTKTVDNKATFTPLQSRTINRYVTTLYSRLVGSLDDLHSLGVVGAEALQDVYKADMASAVKAFPDKFTEAEEDDFFAHSGDGDDEDDDN